MGLRMSIPPAPPPVVIGETITPEDFRRLEMKLDWIILAMSKALAKWGRFL